jgi:hypothetical protein
MEINCLAGTSTRITLHHIPTDVYLLEKLSFSTMWASIRRHRDLLAASWACAQGHFSHLMLSSIPIRDVNRLNGATITLRSARTPRRARSVERMIGRFTAAIVASTRKLGGESESIWPRTGTGQQRGQPASCMTLKDLTQGRTSFTQTGTTPSSRSRRWASCRL